MISDGLFQQYRTLIYQKTGINLSSEKKELLHARLGKRLRACGLQSYEDYFKLVVSDQSGSEFTQFINSISTNFTSFFREENHFNILTGTILPALAGRSASERRPITIWSSACSSGEEPYTLSMVLEEYFLQQRGGAGYRIIATDISTKVLEQAERGVYPMERIDKVPQEYLRKYFLKGVGKSAGYVKMKPVLRQAITFRHFNLMESFPWRAELDVIFCRNVMIYFDRATQQQLINKFYDSLAPSGYLLIGHSESISSLQHRFKQIESTVFRKD